MSTLWRARTGARVSDHPSRAQAEAAARPTVDDLLQAIDELADVTGITPEQQLRQVIWELQQTTAYRREIVDRD